jgi:transcription antitermination factor NusG
MVSIAARWVAVWTRSRQEKTVYEQLVGSDVEAFLPLLTVPSTRRDRRKMIRVPAFPGYLFARVGGPEDEIVKYTRGVVRIVGPTPTDHSSVPDDQIEAVRRMVDSDLQVDPFPYIKVGSAVWVKSGPLRGLSGYLVAKRRKLRFVVSVDLLNRGVCADVSADQVEPA